MHEEGGSLGAAFFIRKRGLKDVHCAAFRHFAPIALIVCVARGPNCGFGEVIGLATCLFPR